MPRKTTSQDVADLAGVSRSAVSLVLNGRGDGNISQVKQQAILEAARQLQYTPNSVALSLRSQRTRTIGVLIWGGPRRRTWQVLYAALQTAAQFGYLLLIMDTYDDAEAESGVIDALRNRQVDGFLVIAPEPGPYRPQEALLGLPAVLVNCHDPAHRLTSIASDPDYGDALPAVGDQAVRLLLDEIANEHHTSRRIVAEQAVIVDTD